MKQRILSTLLHYANSDPPWDRREFYGLKDRLLRKYASFQGHVIQEIRKECYGPREWNDRYGDYDYAGCKGETCPRCRGTGLFDIRWVRLQVWHWGRFTFHIPDGDTRTKPEKTADIIGRIQHEDYGDKSLEACLWLYLLCGEWKLFWNACSGRRCGRYWWPLMNVQRVIMELRMRLRTEKCFRCGKRYFPRWSNWTGCRKCKKENENNPEEIPF